MRTIKLPEFKELQGSGLLAATPVRRDTILNELYNFVKSIPIPARIDDRARLYDSTVGRALLVHTATLMRHYPTTNKILREKIESLLDVESLTYYAKERNEDD